MLKIIKITKNPIETKPYYVKHWPRKGNSYPWRVYWGKGRTSVDFGGFKTKEEADALAAKLNAMPAPFRKNPAIKKGDMVRINAPGLPGHGKTGRVLGSHGDHFQIESGPTEHKNYMHPASRLTVVRKNPKRKKKIACGKKTRKVIRARKNPSKEWIKSLPKITRSEIEKLIDTGHSVYVYPKKGLAVVDGFKKYQYSGPKITAKKNPYSPKRHETIICGIFLARSHKAKTVYFTGDGFSRKASDAKVFPGDGAKLEARRILPMLPPKIERIWTQAA